MTVWQVNTAAAAEGAHRHFASLREAVPHILAGEEIQVRGRRAPA
jgi:mannitol-1-/sugar-/sorbitol-6-phosphatase